MKNFYEVGRVYVWQNLTLDSMRHLNGTETTVTGDVVMVWSMMHGRLMPGQPTDTALPDGRTVAAAPGHLRPKNPPPGEQSVLDMFKQPELVNA